MNIFSRSIILLVSLVAANAQGQSADWKSLNLDLSNNVIVPAYRALADEAAAMNLQAQDFCAAPAPGAMASLQQDFHSTMDAWQAIQHVKFGPVTYFNWQFRMQYWPDDRGTGGRQLEAMLAAEDSSVLEAETFARQSVGVQGLPALERLLFDAEALQALQQAPYRCELLIAITANLSEISKGMADRWQDEFRLTAMLEDDSGFFEDLEDASTDFVKALVETVPVLYEQKLAVVLGDSREALRERRAESWRSGRSLRNLRVNLASLYEYYHADGGELAIESIFQANDAAAVESVFEQVLALSAGISDDFITQAATEEGYARLQALNTSLESLYEALETAVKNTDLYLGFNSLDGD